VRDEIEQVLITTADLFAWSLTDMPGIDPDFMCHKLALLPHDKPVAWRKSPNCPELGSLQKLSVLPGWKT